LGGRRSCRAETKTRNDYGWFSDADLQIVIEKGKVEIHQAELRVLQLKAQQAQKSFNAGQISAKELSEAESGLKNAKAALAPYEAEASKREAKIAAISSRQSAGQAIAAIAPQS
jgi:outer membrane protein TolC